jgi:protein dithiol oxidoreductase (disulfide-forming)
MRVSRRAFTATALALGAASAWAQGGPQEGRDYTRVSPPQPGAKAGSIEVIEFFWYGCPHCAAFEPTLAAWQQRQLPDVTLRRVPVAFRENPYRAHQQLFYALEAMGQLAALHAKVFRTIHLDHVRLDTPQQIADFAAASGLDRAAFLQAYGSFSVQTKAAEATRLAQAFKVDGVPSLGVQGLYYTSGTLAGSPERALTVADALVAKVRSGA